MKNISTHIMDAIIDEVEAPLAQVMHPLMMRPLYSENAIRAARRKNANDFRSYYFTKNKTLQAMRPIDRIHSTMQFALGFEITARFTFI